MRITPLDVRKQEFRKVVRGLDADEVYAFLATVADEYEAALSDNKQLRERLLDLDEKVNEYRNMEKTLRDTLLTAERVMSDARQNAKKEADLILRDARLKADQETSNISDRVESLKTQLRELRGHRDAFLARLKGLSEAQIGLVSSYQKEFEREDATVRVAASPRFRPEYEEPAVAPGPVAAPVAVAAPDEDEAEPSAPLRAQTHPTPSHAGDPQDVWRNYLVGASHRSEPHATAPASDHVANLVQEFEQEAGSGHPEEVVASSAASIEAASPAEDDIPPSSEDLEPTAASPGGWSMKRFTQGLGEV